MRLLVISNMSHFYVDGQLQGNAPTVEEFNHLATLFDEMIVIGCLHTGEPDRALLPYAAANVRFVPVPPAGGESLGDKLDILRLAPHYLRVMSGELRKLGAEDVVHVRAPANISLLALPLLSATRQPQRRWVKFGGDWQPPARAPLGSTVQRWWLRRGWQRGVVTINGYWDGQPAHIHDFLNPCLTQGQVEGARELASNRQLSDPLRLIYVGRLESRKGLDMVLRVTAELHQRGLSITLKLVGDGQERQKFDQLAEALNIAHLVTFTGWLSRDELGTHYAESHILLFPSLTEGLPKVIGEGLAYGVVPVASAVGSVPYYLRRFGVGRALPPDDRAGFVAAVQHYHDRPDQWHDESRQAQEAAPLFTYEHYLEAVRELLALNHD